MSLGSAYFESLKEIEEAEVFIAESTDKLNQEISQNMWVISMTSYEASLVSRSDLIDFFNRVIFNRKQQLSESSLKVDLQFYLWFDEQACQLRFNLINSKHEKLPFSCAYTLAERPDEIIESFLFSNYHDGIPFSNAADVSGVEKAVNVSEASDEPLVLRVYSAIIKAD